MTDGNSGTLARRETMSLTLKERLSLKKNQPVLLLDVSGSMALTIEIGHRRIDALREIVRQFNSPKIAFSDSAKVVVDVPAPSGGTYMSKAIDLAKSLGHKSGVIITDGANSSSDEQAALSAVKDFALQIIYVGVGEAPAFLHKLAAKGCGFCTVENLKNPKQLTEKIQLLLNPGNERKDIIL